MKKNSKDPMVQLMTQIQEQLAVLDRKLDAFMTKSLTELAQAKAAAMKPAPVPASVSRPHIQEQRPARQMFAIVCFECGKDSELPFKPAGDRPVFCSECFAKRRAARAADKKLQSAAPSQAISIAPAAPISEPAKGKKAAAKKPTAKKKAAAPKKKTAKKK